MSLPIEAPSDDARLQVKRRKVRKGTHSCWECRRRKMKCIFDPLSVSGSCKACRRRGSRCVSQEFPQEPSSSHSAVSGGAVAAEATTPNEKVVRSYRGIPSPSPTTTNSESLQHLSFYLPSGHCTVGTRCAHSADGNSPVSEDKYENLSRFLHGSLPLREDMVRICRANRYQSVLAHETLTVPYATLDRNGLETPESLLGFPSPDVHPVLIARHMLLLATFLQHLHPDIHEMEGLSEPPRAVMERLADLAINLVTTDDGLLGSIEGLECVMIESLYHMNIGNLRRSWVAVRRALNIAQLMGLDQSDNREIQAQYTVIDPKTNHHPQLMWLRILQQDRHLCLMLGLRQGCLDRSMASDSMFATDTPLGRLERMHCVIASRILERNASKPNSQDLALTRDLDVELQRAARELPSKWWLSPNLAAAPPESADPQALFWDTRRLFAQVLHYSLLNQLHLPYMLHSSSSDKRKYEYSRITCVNASREVLSRFLALRGFNQIAYSCRTIDFIALMAAMTLLLAHLESHHSGADNVLAHQYLSDRAMIEQVRESMQEVNRINSDALSAQSADLLRRLLTIELETADTHPRGAKRVRVHKSGAETALRDKEDDVIVSVHIPYFGIIRIAHEGMTKEASQTHAFRLAGPVSSSASYGHVDAPPSMSRGLPDIHYAREQTQSITLPTPGAGDDDVATRMDPHFQNRLSDPPLQEGEEYFPAIAAGSDDWAFQGVDMAFFDSLMRSTGHEASEEVQWSSIPDAEK